MTSRYLSRTLAAPIALVFALFTAGISQAATIGFDATVTELGSGEFHFAYTISLQTDAAVDLIVLQTSRADLRLADLQAPPQSVVDYDSNAGVFKLFPAFAGTSFPAGTVLTGFSFITAVPPGPSVFTVRTIDGNLLRGNAVAPVPLPPSLGFMVAGAVVVACLRGRRRGTSVAGAH